MLRPVSSIYRADELSSRVLLVGGYIDLLGVAWVRHEVAVEDDVLGIVAATCY